MRKPAHRLILGTEALAAGTATRREPSRDYTKLHRNVYVRNGVELDAKDRAVAAWLWSGRTAVLGGSSAAALLGARWIPGSDAAELIRQRREAPPGVVIRSDTLTGDEVRRIGDITCTSAARTAYDLGRRGP